MPIQIDKDSPEAPEMNGAFVWGYGQIIHAEDLNIHDSASSNATVSSLSTDTDNSTGSNNKPYYRTIGVLCIVIIIAFGLFYFFSERSNLPSTEESQTSVDVYERTSRDNNNATRSNYPIDVTGVSLTINDNKADSEESLRGFLSGFSTRDITQWKYDDYDGNGISEAFAEIVGFDGRHHLWYISIQGAVEVDTVDPGSISRVIRTNSRSFIIWKSEYQYTTSLCSCIGVKMGQWYRLELRGNDFVQDSSGDVYVTEPRFTYDGEYVRYTLCTFDETTLEWVETDKYYQEKKT